MQKSDDRDKAGKREVMRLLPMITQFAITMLVPIVLCFFAGAALDKHFGTKYWTVILFFAGALAGFRNIYVLSRRYFKNDPDSVAAAYKAPEEDRDDE